MKDYNNAFLGVILAGVLMLVTGLALLIRPGLVLGDRDRLTTAESAVRSLVQNNVGGQQRPGAPH